MEKQRISELDSYAAKEFEVFKEALDAFVSSGCPTNRDYYEINKVIFGLIVAANTMAEELIWARERGGILDAMAGGSSEVNADK